MLFRSASRRLRRLATEGQNATDELAYVVEENVLAWRIVRLHGAAAEEGSRFERASNVLRRLLMKSVAASSMITPVTQLLASFALSMVIVVALWQSRSADATVGGFVSFITAMMMLITPIKHLTDVMGPITRGLAALERGVDMIEQTPPEAGGDHATVRARGQLQLDQVSLRYRPDAAPALDGLTLALSPGQTVALVGPSGAGKTSVVNLLPRFIEPSSGVVTLDGVPLPQWQLDALRRQIALVSQDVVLFNDSVAGNVALGGDADRTRVEQALRDANLWEFVSGQIGRAHG